MSSGYVQPSVNFFAFKHEFRLERGVSVRGLSIMIKLVREILKEYFFDLSKSFFVFASFRLFAQTKKGPLLA